MCAVYGFVGFRKDKLLKKMGQVLAHRGPDDQNDLPGENISLGYRRLAIIDVKGGFQPFYSEDKNIILFYNGEIYNYKDLRKKLPGHKFATNCDGETIIHWYEKYRVRGFSKLNGIFGFALYDKQKKKLFLVRDHLGVKPLYYYTNKNSLIFASEIKAILLHKIPIAPNDKIIRRYLLSRIHDDHEETFFRGIKRVPAGGFLTWDLTNSKFQVRRYWQLKSKLNRKSDEENITRFKELFLDSIQKQLMSEVPVGTALSGGLDSSAVVLAANSGNTKYQSFSAIFPGAVNNEKEFIDEVLTSAKVEDHFVEPKRDEFWQDIKKLIATQEEPMISSGPYAQWKVMQLATKNKIRVMLDGQGADEMLAGYDPYFFVYLRQLLSEKKYWQFFKETLLSIDITRKYLFAKRFNVQELFIGGVKQKNIINNLNRRLIQDVTADSLPALLRYEDKNSMAFSIEARVPFLDYRLVEFIAWLPAKYKIRDGWTKWVMRQALKDLLPQKIRNRRWKVGFTTPEVSWLRQSSKEIREILNSPSFNRRPYFNHAKIRQRYEEFLAGKNDESLVFWRVINLELWLRHFMDTKD